MLRSGFTLLIATSVLAYLVLVSPEPSSGQIDEPRLFSLQTQPAAVAESERSSVASVREAEIAFAHDARSLGRSEKLRIPLFDNAEHEAVLSGVEHRADDDITWRGKINDGDIVITLRKGVFAGLVYGPDAVYEIVPRGVKHMLVQLDQRMFPECGGAVGGTSGDRKAPEQTAGGISDSGDRIDVIVVYTTATRNLLGGDTQAQAFAQLAIDSTNTAYINSRIRQRLRMVHTEEFVYTETSSASTDLSNLRGNATIAALRDAHRGDLVAGIGEISGACGIGYLLNVPGGVLSAGYTFTARSCAIGNLSFAHEIGHNMGSHHNPENAGTPIYQFGFGHYVNGSYRTVMSYVDPCPSGCTRRPYFSNPSVSFDNVPTGIDNFRDNARLINATADWVASYRYSGSSITMSNFNGGDWLPRLVTRNLTWKSDNIRGDVRIDISRDEGTTWETLVATTPDDGSEPIPAGNRATRRARLRVVSLNNPAVSDSSVRNLSIR